MRSLSKIGAPLVAAAALIGCKANNDRPAADVPVKVATQSADIHRQTADIVSASSDKDGLKMQLNDELRSGHQSIRAKFTKSDAHPNGQTPEELDREETTLWNASTPDLKHSSLSYKALTPYQQALVDFYAREAQGWRKSGLSTQENPNFFVAEDIKDPAADEARMKQWQMQQ
jgi:hypothetical protein